MFDVLTVLSRSLLAIFKTREQLVLENLALRHQIHVLKRKKKRPHLKPSTLLRLHRALKTSKYRQRAANLRILQARPIRSVPHVPVSHPFVERLIGTDRRE